MIVNSVEVVILNCVIAKLNQVVLKRGVLDLKQVRLLMLHLGTHGYPPEARELGHPMTLAIRVLIEAPGVLKDYDVLAFKPEINLFFTLASGSYFWVTSLQADHKILGLGSLIVPKDLGLFVEAAHLGVVGLGPLFVRWVRSEEGWLFEGRLETFIFREVVVEAEFLPCTVMETYLVDIDLVCLLEPPPPILCGHHSIVWVLNKLRGAVKITQTKRHIESKLFHD